VSLSVKRGNEVLEKSLQLAQVIPPLVPQQLGITAEAIADVDQADAENAPITVTGVVKGTPADGQLEVGDRIQSIGDSKLSDLPSLRRRIFTADPDVPLKLSIL